MSKNWSEHILRRVLIGNTALVKFHRPICPKFTLLRATLRHGNTRRKRSL